MQDFEDAAAIADRADQKLAVAADEREEKSAAYLNDPLFSYLWDRGFSTTEYKGGRLFKMIDGWIARKCKYDGARANFARLQDITDWLKDHAATTRQAADSAKTVLEDAERAAIKDAGIPVDEDEAAKLREKITEIDSDIEAEEAVHADLVSRHSHTLLGEDGPAKQARKLLERGLKQMRIPDLRQLAAETVSLDDDEIVDELVNLRTEEMSLELETERVSDAPSRLRGRLEAFESLRRLFKGARYDSDSAMIKIALFDDALERLASGESSVERAHKQIRQSVRRKKRRTRTGFGGRYSGSGNGAAEEIIGVIAEEALRYGMRRYGGESRSGRYRSSKRGSRRRTKRNKGGGFKTGGGF